MSNLSEKDDIEIGLPDCITMISENRESNFGGDENINKVLLSLEDIKNHMFTPKKNRPSRSQDSNFSQQSTENSGNMLEDDQENWLNKANAAVGIVETTFEIIDPNKQSQTESPHIGTIVEEGNEHDESNLKNESSSPSSPSDIKKGKSNPLPEEVSSIYTKLKEYYSELPAIFRLDGIRKKQKTHFFKWIKRLLDQKIAKIPGYSQFKKLNQKCIAKADLKFNSALFKKTVCEVYFDDSVENNNLMQVLINNYNNEDCDTLMLLLDTPLYQVYDLYLESPEFKSDFKKIERKTKKEADDSDPQEKQYILLYLEVYKILSREFVKYYMSTAPNKRTSPTNRRPKKNKKFWKVEPVERVEAVEPVEPVERVEPIMTDSEQANPLSTKEESFWMCESESDSGSEFY